MNLLQIREFVRAQTFSTASQVTDAQLNSYINIIYKTLVDEISQDVREDYMSDVFTVENMFAGQSEYTLPEITTLLDGSKLPGLNNVTGIYIDYKGDGNYVKARQEKLSNLDNDLSYYMVNQPYTAPMHIIYDNGYQIFPAPTTSVADGIKVYGTYDVVPLENDIDVPLITDAYHYVIGVGAKQYVFAQRGQTDLKDEAKNDFKYEKEYMLNNLGERNLSPIERIYPNTTQYE